MNQLNLFIIRTMVAKATATALLQCRCMDAYDAQGKLDPSLSVY